MKIIIYRKIKIFKQYIKKYGLIEPNSLFYDSNSNVYHFTITNHKDTVDIIYKGHLPLEMKEGENIIATGYFTNSKRRDKIIAHHFMTNHSMEVENWSGNANVLKDNDMNFK